MALAGTVGGLWGGVGMRGLQQDSEPHCGTRRGGGEQSSPARTNDNSSDVAAAPTERKE